MFKGLEQNNLDPTVKKLKNIIILQQFSFTRPSSNIAFDCHNPEGFKFATQPYLGVRYLYIQTQLSGLAEPNV